MENNVDILAKFHQYSKEVENAKTKNGNYDSYFPKVITDNNKRKEFEQASVPGKVLEENVGITNYISNHEGFKGILKHRYTDFQVREISKNGNVLELTDISVPETLAEDSISNIDKSILPEDLWFKIEEILSSEDNDKEKFLEIKVTDKNKEERTLIHKTLKAVYTTSIFSNTITKDTETFIKVGKRTNANNDRGGCNWPKSLPKFLHFTICKMNMDTTQCIFFLSQKLRTKPNKFTYAGTKDRRAVTTQRMCVERKMAEDVSKVNVRGVKIGNYEYKANPLRLGDLSGNKFTITIRNLEDENDVIETALNDLKSNGFINYFGLQRFGSSQLIPTYAVGKAIMKKDWKLAVELILKPRADEKNNAWIKQARKAWWTTRDAAQSLKMLSWKNSSCLEFKVLKALKQSPTNYLGALHTIPRNTLTLYLHSYQSLVWNKIVSQRIAKFKLEPQVGDLVISSEVPNEEPQEETTAEVESEDEEEDPEASVVQPVEEFRKRILVKAVTEETIGNTSIYDIVYPLPGFDVEYPKNEISEWYKEILKEDGITEEDLKKNHSEGQKLFSMYGTYRKPFAKVIDFDWKIVNHTDLNDDLVLTDFQKVEKQSLKTPQESPDTKYKSLIMDLTLPPSTYATMVIREVMKTDTSARFHTSLTNIARENSAKKIKISLDSTSSKEEQNGET